VNFNVITGLPRSGSTLLCNLLNQRPDTYASSTSALPQVANGIATVLTNSPEETSRLENIPGTDDHHVRIVRNLIEGWHDTDKPVVFDKSRGWARNALLLHSAIPDAGIIVTVRDPREVLASIERRNRETGVYEPGGDLFARCNTQVAENGLVGGPIGGVEDLIRRKLPNVEFVTYDQFVAAPARTMATIEKVCGLEPHEYDFDNVESTATDADVVYRNKFPHKGSGPVKPVESGWSDVIPDDIAKGTLARWPLFCSTFGYR